MPHLNDFGKPFTGSITVPGSTPGSRVPFPDLKIDDEVTLRFRRPDSTGTEDVLATITSVRHATFAWVVTAGFLDVVGEWEWQVIVTRGVTLLLHSNIGRFTVSVNLAEPV